MDYFASVPDFGHGFFDPVEPPTFIVDVGHDHAHVAVPAVPDVHDHLHCGGQFSNDDHGVHLSIGCENDFSITHH